MQEEDNLTEFFVLKCYRILLGNMISLPFDEDDETDEANEATVYEFYANYSNMK